MIFLIFFFLILINFFFDLLKGKAGKMNEDFIILTNYRLFLLLNNETSFINFPIMLIEYVEMKEIFYIYVYLKNVKTVK